MNRINFQKDLRYGKRGEKFFLKKIKQKYNDAYIESGYCKGYDIVVPSAGICIECKLDRLSPLTGNIAIEYEDKGSLSGIDSTQADFWGLVFGSKEDGRTDWYWTLINTNKLKWLCRDAGRKAVGGDNREAKMYLIPVQQFLFLHDANLIL